MYHTHNVFVSTQGLVYNQGQVSDYRETVALMAQHKHQLNIPEFHNGTKDVTINTPIKVMSLHLVAELNIMLVTSTYPTLSNKEIRVFIPNPLPALFPRL